MRTLSNQLGFLAALSIAICFILFTVCFVAIAMKPPLFVWTNLNDYLTYAAQNEGIWQSIARATMLAFGPLYLILLACLHDYAPDSHKILVKISIYFGIIFATLTGMHYFIQLSAAPWAAQQGYVQGLEHWLQANPLSPISAINMLGWTLFFGLSSLFVSFIFWGSPTAVIVRIAWTVNGIFCLLGGIGYIFQMLTLLFVTINLGMGGAVLVAAIGLCFWFRQQATRRL